MDVAEMRRDMKKEGAMCQYGLCGNPHAPHTYDGKKVCSDHYEQLTEDEDAEFHSLRDVLSGISIDFGRSDPSDPEDGDNTTMTEDDHPDAERVHDPGSTEHAEIGLWRNYDQQKVGVETAEMGRQLLHPDKARQMAASLEDEFGDDARDLIDDLKRFADDVDPRKTGDSA